jgi:SAM-dependent methyltransferase
MNRLKEISGSNSTSHQDNCLVCAAQSFNYLYQKNGFNLWQCQQCGLIFTDGKGEINSLSNLYAERYPLEIFWQERPRKLKKSAAELKLLEKYSAPSKLLDVGCSYGFFLEVARQRGWQVQGVELSAQASRWAREENNLAVFNGTVQAANFPPESFDVISIRHVLEHIPEVDEVLAEIYRLLKPGGLCLVAVPNINSLNYRLNRQAWWWIDPPTHWWYFSRFTLKLLLERHGFRVRFSGTYRADDQTVFQATVFGANQKWQILARLRRFKARFYKQPLEVKPVTQDENAGIDRQNRWSQVVKIGEFLHRYLRPLGWLLDKNGLGGEVLIIAEKVN